MKTNSKLLLGVIMMVITVIIIFLTFFPKNQPDRVPDRKLITKSGVCPPFYLYDEENNRIDPVHNMNAGKPYSPKQTCGKCHDYDKITKGFHFQQGKDEQATGTFADRYQWVSSPGNYGGNWCSPAPVYRYLSKKSNKSPKEMDMTSFDFITATCGSCHPGGGPLEFDRSGKRYDKQMEAMHYVAGGDNNYDGDYYKAYWNRTGVIEGDCMLCHFPEYDYKGRNKQLDKWNFRWLATVGSGLATVDGSIKDSVEVSVKYDVTKFDADGKVSLHLVREPRNETCLNCHAKPQWKKRGASFTAETDVHIAKGLKCVDCHAAGSMAVDARIKGKEIHQFGKGDDPSGNVRNDLDNTVRTCKDCHLTGYQNAPIAKHDWLPSFHLDKIACQTCHIPERRVKSALVQVSDVYNPGTKISPPPKYIWTFYDQHMNYWNHYGELAMFTNKDQPADPFIPQYAKYKGQIFPVNPVHSAWPGIYTEGKKGLDQPKMKDIFGMWTAHRKDASKYPELSLIKDDNADSIPEVNTPQEIDAFIHSVTAFMKIAGYNMQGKKIVWVNDDRMYFSGNDYKLLDKETFESSPYASVYKYSHDVLPAKAGLGVRGCTDCHSFSSPMFFGQVVKYPFGVDGKPVYERQYKRLGMNRYLASISVIREQYIKPVSFIFAGFLLILILLNSLMNINLHEQFFSVSNNILRIIYGFILIIFAIILLLPEVGSYILPERLLLDKNHFWIALFVLGLGTYIWLRMRKEKETSSGLRNTLGVTILFTLLFGVFMLMKFNIIQFLTRNSYTLFDLCILLIEVISMLYLIRLPFRRIDTNR